MSCASRRHSLTGGLVLASVFIAAVLKCTSGLATDKGTVIDGWVRLAEEHALRVEDGSDQYDVWYPIAEFHARCGDLSGVRQAAYRISDKSLRNACLQFLAATIAQIGDRTAALRIARLIDGPAGRNAGFADIVSFTASRHDFAGAAETIELVDNFGLQQELWYGLACEQARVGYHDSALKTARKFLGVGFDGKKDKDDLLKFIAEAKRTGARKKPTEFRTGIYDGLRALGRNRWTPDAEELSDRAGRGKE